MSLPFVEPPALPIRLPIHIFGAIVVVGITLGAAVMRRYARRVGESEDDARRVAAWVAATGIAGAHVFDVLFYRPGEALRDPLVLLEFWTSISSYGGFIGGALGFIYIVRRRRLRVARWADITIVGLLVAFTIGRVGCATVHDHVGAETSSAIGIDFPRDVVVDRGVVPPTDPRVVIRAHDLGFDELLLLIPITALACWLALRRRPPAGALAALAPLLYAPVRFTLERWRPASTDPPYVGLTFAQWGSIVAFAIAIVALARVIRANAASAGRSDS